MKIFRFLAPIALIFSSILIISCESTVQVVITPKKTEITFSADGGEAFSKTLALFTGGSDFSENGKCSETSSIFDTSEIKQSFEEVGFSSVNCTVKGKSALSVKFSPVFPKDLLSSSGLLKLSADNKPYFELSRENLLSFYNLAPFELKSYIDLFMAPSFTEEEMTDEEYLDLIASVFGPTLSEEIKNAKISFVFEDSGKKSTKTFSLLTILNLTGKLYIG